MEISTMSFPQASLQLIRGLARRQATLHRRRPLDRHRTRFRLDCLEERCLLSGISSVTEFSLPSGSGLFGYPGGITAGPDGNLWFTEISANAVGMINPTTHAISSFAIPTSNSQPRGITSGPDGNLWFIEKNANKIGMINPSTDAISEFSLPAILDTVPTEITSGPDGNLWFTEWAGSHLGAINPTTHAISAYSVTPSLFTVAITSGPDGNLWFTTRGPSPADIGVINPTTGAVSTFPCPNLVDEYGSITAGSDGNLWFTFSFKSLIGMINPTTDAITEFTDPYSNSATFGITAGPDGNLWFTDRGNSSIGTFDLTTRAITEYPIPFTGAGPAGIVIGPDGNLWFTDPGNNAIGVATLASSQMVVTTQPPASVTAGSGFGFTVTAEDSSGNTITSFNGTVTVALASNPGGSTLGGTLTTTASGGVASFTGLTLNKAASGYTLFTSGGGYGWGVTSQITVTPAAASQLVITQQPPATVKVNTAFGLQASIEDVYGNVVTTASNTVSVAFANNPTGATLGGTLSMTASQGVVTFSNLTINKTGSGYMLQVSSSGLTSAVTSSINVTKIGKTPVPLVSSGTTAAPDTLLGPLVLDSPDLLDGMHFKKRPRTI
jgi:streptogramin lyase